MASSRSYNTTPDRQTDGATNSAFPTAQPYSAQPSMSSPVNSGYGGNFRSPSGGTPPGNKHRPTPLNLSNNAHESWSQNGPEPSPRAAIVAGLRSATDRRSRKRDLQVRDEQTQQYLQQVHLQEQLKIHHQQQQQLLFLQQQQLRMQNLSLNDGGYANDITGRTSFTPDYNNSDSLDYYASNNPDPQLIARLQQKRQELLATNAMLAQQQQRLAQGYTTPYYNDNQGYMSSAGFGSEPSLSSSQYYAPKSQNAQNSFYNTDLPLPGSGGYQFPSSPSIPARPNSSSSFRSDFTHQTQYSNGSSSPGQRSHHRKANSMSYNPYTPKNSSFSPYNSQASGGLNASQLRNDFSFGRDPSGSRVGGGEYTIPLRQPIGPPPLDELKGDKRDRNFASISTYTHDGKTFTRIASQ